MDNSLNISNFKMCEWSKYIFGYRNLFLIAKAMALVCIIYCYSYFDENFISKLSHITLGDICKWTYYKKCQHQNK